MASKRIFILGAGSSIGHSKGLFPSITGFFSAATKLGLSSQNEFMIVAEYAKDILGHDILSSKDRTDIEALFTNIEIEVEKKPSLELMTVRQQLLKLIQSVLIGLENNLDIKIGEYNEFVSQLEKKDTILTFNWDLLLDRTLNRDDFLTDLYKDKTVRIVGDTHYLKFIMELSALGDGTWQNIGVNKPYQQWSPESGYFLKMHGSIDWFYCANKTCRAADKAFPLIEPTKIHYCSECHENLESLLIPPILNKAYRQYPLIRRIWNLASKEISLADNLIIWGYSLPSTDFYTFWLLRQARKSIRTLILIDPNIIDRKRNIIKVSFLRKFYDLFRGIIKPESIMLYESFSNYYNKYSIWDKYRVSNTTRLYTSL
jgi:NAD-dependent SIR2 family protein deacetylase